MALIKDAQAREMARQALVLDLGDLTRQGQMMIEKAKAEAEKILMQARKERDHLIAGASEKGFEKGYAEGLAQGQAVGAEQGKAEALNQAKQRIEQLEKAWTAALSGFDETRTELLNQLQQDVLHLALLIAAKVTKRVIRNDPKVVVEQTRAVLEMIARPTSLVLMVNPADRSMLEQMLPGLMGQVSMVRSAKIVEDESLSLGSVIARAVGDSAVGAEQHRGGMGGGARGGMGGGGGEIDASIPTQLQRIVDMLVPGSAAPDLDEQGGEAARKV